MDRLPADSPPPVPIDPMTTTTASPDYSKPTPYEKINKFLHLVASTPEGIKEELLYVPCIFIDG